VPRANEAVEAVLLEYADLISILSDDPFKPRAYEKAARAVGGYPADVSGFDVKQLQGIPNVGKSIAEKVHEFLATGTMGALEELRAQIPAGVRQLMAIPGLGWTGWTPALIRFSSASSGSVTMGPKPIIPFSE